MTGSDQCLVPSFNEGGGSAIHEMAGMTGPDEPNRNNRLYVGATRQGNKPGRIPEIKVYTVQKGVYSAKGCGTQQWLNLIEFLPELPFKLLHLVTFRKQHYRDRPEVGSRFITFEICKR